MPSFADNRAPDPSLHSPSGLQAQLGSLSSELPADELAWAQMVDGAAESLMLEPAQQELKEVLEKNAALKAQLEEAAALDAYVAAQEAYIVQLYKQIEMLEKELAEPKCRKAAN